jgi:RNA polymerase sigma-70 factor (ECF subfamily)
VITYTLRRWWLIGTDLTGVAAIAPEQIAGLRRFCCHTPRVRDHYPPGMPTSDEIVARARSGDFAALVERYSSLVVGVAFAITRDHALAEDLAQETFLVAWRQLATLDDPARAGGWLAGIARNLANSAIRKQVRRRTLDDVLDPAPVAGTPHDEVAQAELVAQLRGVLDELPVAQRDALVIYYFADGNVDDVAAGLGVTGEVARQRLHRARVATRDRLTARLEGELRALRPSAAFQGVVIAAVSTLAAVAVTKPAAATTFVATHATKGKLMLAAKLTIAATAVAALGGATIYKVSARTSSSSAPAAGSTARHIARAPAAPANGPVHLAPSPEHRADLADAIATARQRRLAAPARPQLPPPTTTTPHQPAATATPPCTEGDDACVNQYLMSVTESIIPLIKDCREQRLEQDPRAAVDGTFRVRSNLETEPGVGAVVTDVTFIEDQTTVADLPMRECIRETMYAIEVDPAAIPGELTFETAVSLSSSGEPD